MQWLDETTCTAADGCMWMKGCYVDCSLITDEATCMLHFECFWTGEICEFGLE
jgi:hypothetical protein